MRNQLFYGDNLQILREFASESVDLIYLDPPFNSKRNYFVLFKDRTGRPSEAQEWAFDDTWTWSEESESTFRHFLVECPNTDLTTIIRALYSALGVSPMMAYLVAMAVRLYEMHRVLKPAGSLYLHCDPTASHYLKIVLDAIFEPQNFRNEITWQRTTAHSDTKGKWPERADIIFYYAKSKATPFYPVYTTHNTGYVESFYKFDDGDGRGLYRKDNLQSPNPRPNLMYEWLGYSCPKKGWVCNQERMQLLHDEGRIFYPKHKDGSPDYSKRLALKRYLNEQKGQLVGSIWTDIAPVQAKGESLGYPTQKPLALLERIISASSSPEDIVLDPFCGCGTSVTAAHKLGRRWIGIDITAVAIGVIKARLEQSFPDDLQGKVQIEGFPRDLESARALFEQDPFRFQVWACTLINAYPITKRGADRGIDGWLRFMDYDDTVYDCVVQVKGGKLQAGQVRDFCRVVDREDSPLGFLLTMGDVTKPMRDEAIQMGLWTSAARNEYPRVQLLSIADLLTRAERARYPAQDKNSILGYKAERLKKEGAQGTLAVFEIEEPGRRPSKRR